MSPAPNRIPADAARVLVVAKAPQPGRTKTRLAATVGDVRAAELSAAALLDTVRACREAFGTSRCNLSLAGDLDDAVDAARLQAALAGWTIRSQTGGDFGDRLARAHQEIDGPVIQIGTDTPQITPNALQGVVDLLDGADAVLGPATDGGWWVLALNDPRHAACLRDVPMSIATTGEHTLAALRGRGLAVALAPEMHDVDVAADAEIVARLAPDTEFARSWQLAVSAS
ncbi:MAG: TIGR04282 family arsenosugar biosynthesis glycosyltransferase [Aeromicrobium sp.]